MRLLDGSDPRLPAGEVAAPMTPPPVTVPVGGASSPLALGAPAATPAPPALR